MSVRVAEKRLNSAVKAQAEMGLASRDDDSTQVSIHTEASILGKLGEFGGAVMREKADKIVAEFARNMARELGAISNCAWQTPPCDSLRDR
jgi:carbon monoxide dehydrogenase subunit G